MLSIIIPTKNEENYLPLLLESIKHQNSPDLEIIVADAYSKDGTRSIAKNYGCKIVDGGLPAKARNNGAKYSQGEFLAFIDSDVILPNGFLEKALKEFNDKNLDIATTLQYPIPTNKKLKDLKHKIIYSVVNNWMKIMENTKKPCIQACMFVKKDIHEKIGGFDETLVFGEYEEYGKRAKKIGKFEILNERVFISPRRFDEGIPFILKCLYFDVGRFFGHEFKENSRIKYFKD